MVRNGRGRSRGQAASGQRGGRVARGGTTMEPSASVDATDLMTVEADAFFEDLTGASRPDRRRCRSHSGMTDVVDSAFAPAALSSSSAPAAAIMPGESVAIRSGIAGSEQTQDKVLWLELGLCKALVRAVTQLGFIVPTPVQVEAIPAALSGADVCARSVTGSGKTAAFLLPLLHLLLTRPPRWATELGSRRRYVRSLVLLPTRELGVQCEGMLRQLLSFTSGLTVALVVGGVAPAAQKAALDAVPDILIATPGRLVDLLHNYVGGGGSDLSGVEVLVIDECDKMLTTTLLPQVEAILKRVPEATRQMLLFSATMTDDVDAFAREHLFKPREVDIGHVALQSKLLQQFVRVRVPELVPDVESGAEGGEPPATKRIRSKRLREEAASAAPRPSSSAEAELEHVTKIKSRYLVALCRSYFTRGTIIFCKYRSTVHRLALLFNRLGMPAAEVQGNQPQQERFAALQSFVAGEVHFLLTTDVAARGLDLRAATVINFDLPPTLTAYIHRVGRTARIGDAGTAVSLVDERRDAAIMRKILAVSGAIDHHQHYVASVKRRDIPEELLREAGEAIDGVFLGVREELAAEQLEQRITQAEKRFGRTDAVSESITAKPIREWCLSLAERNRREAEARASYEKEAEVTMNRFQNELSQLEREEARLLREQRRQRRVEREAKARVQDRVKEKARALVLKSQKRMEAGVVKKLKQRKLREAVREKRAAERVNNKVATRKSRENRRQSKKSRHRKRMKRH